MKTNKIKNIILIAAAIFALNISVQAANYTLEWDHDALPTDNISFTVEKKDVNGVWVAVSNTPAGVKFAEFLNVDPGTATYRVVAVSPLGLKSDPSNELVVSVPNSPKTLRFRIK